jgi:hypothetical protein
MAEARRASDAPPGLRLLAEDADDLQVISAALQDAVLQVGDIIYEPKGRRLTIALNRFRWEAADVRRGERIRSALQVGGVTAVKARRVKREPRDAVVELLALTFEPGEAPGGSLVFSFAGDADLRVEVECVDAVLADVSRPWSTKRAPAHDLG